MHNPERKCQVAHMQGVEEPHVSESANQIKDKDHRAKALASILSIYDKS